MPPYQTETMESCMRRSGDAIKRVWEVDPQRPDHTGDRPGLHRENIFDLTNGIRLIVSNEKYPWFDEPVIHMSGSIRPVSELGLRMRMKDMTIEQMLHEIESSFQSLFGVQMFFLGFTEGKGIPHWYSKDMTQCGRNCLTL